jgi:hypothetical protein
MAEYDVGHINSLLENVEQCTVSSFTLDGLRINSRHMNFASASSLESFYLMTNKMTYKLKEFRNNPAVTLAILGNKGSFEGYFQATVFGKIEMLDKFADPVVQNALDRLGAKNGLAKKLKESGSLGDSFILRLGTEEIHFSVMANIMKGVPQTIIKFP